MKVTKKRVSIVLPAAFLFLGFLSKTLYTFNLPEITGARPFRGTLDKLEISYGIAEWERVDSIYAASSGTAGRVLVKEGDAVSAGEVVFYMDFDIASARRKLKELDNNIQKINNDILYMRSKLETLDAALSGNEARNLAAIEIAKAQASLKSAEIFYEYGGISASDLKTARDNMEALYLKYENDRADLLYNLRSKNLDGENLRLQREALVETLRDYNDYGSIVSPSDGVIISLPVKRGQAVSENALLFSIGSGDEFVVECAVPLENDFILAGDKCYLENSTHTIEGFVSRVKTEAQGKVISIAVSSKEITAGETFDVRFEKKSSTAYTLVPNSALNQDTEGYFLFRIKRRKGILGDEYYVERLDVYIGDSDYKNTVVSHGITFFEPVVLASSKIIQAGDTVLLVNAGDFYDN
jgi:biotin carboxyl carrier protein